MTSGMAGVAGTILAAYASMGIRIEYLLAASFMAAPGGHPDGQDHHARRTSARPERPSCRWATMPEPIEADRRSPRASHDEEKPANIIMAAAQGAQTGVRLAVAVGAMVLAFVALVALANGLLAGVGSWFGYPTLSFQATARRMCSSR